MKKIAVVLFNLGGPDSRQSIRPFLFNFFMDRNIIRAPLPIRFLLAQYISLKRSRREAGQSYGELGGKSPLLDNTRAQASALEKKLNETAKGREYKVFVSMRYWHPMAPQIVQEVRDWGAEKIVQLPLYPQFSTTTGWSSFENWTRAATKANLDIPSSAICCYPENTGFIDSATAGIAAEYKKAQANGHRDLRILFSAHGLPEKIVRGGDPYQWQCERTAEKIAQKLIEDLGIENLDWQSCYQSRVGPMKWIGPSIEDAIKQAAREGKSVIVYPHAFTQEHVETLVELDIEYRHLAEKEGLPGYYRAQTAGADERFIAALAKLVEDHLDGQGVCAEGGKRLCPDSFSRCCMRHAEKIAA